jgi:hypothetical protein
MVDDPERAGRHVVADEGRLDDLRKNGQNPEIVKELISLSKQYRIATPQGQLP